MKKASSTRDTSRGTRIATLECELAQLRSQLTALQTRVGTLEGVNKEQQKTVARQLEALAEPAGPVRAISEEAEGEHPSIRMAPDGMHG